MNIPEFFSDRSILITGTTGFIGKGVVEKLLRSCPKIKTIYALIRNKKGENPHDRIIRALESPIYDVVRKDSPEQFDKVIAIPGDISLPLLGISEFDMATILSEVTVIIHLAATIKFNEHLRIATEYNVVATQEAIKIAKMIPNFVSMVHVSTAYANCDRSEVEEKIYEMDLNPHKHIEIMKVLDDEMIDFITPKLLGSRPNTYTLTKAMAEQIVKEESSEIPISIVRPSIVMGTWKEPFSGFVDNFTGNNGLIAGILNGNIKALHSNEKHVIDIIPLDKIVNLIIVTAWKTAIIGERNLKIYNSCSSDQNPTTVNALGKTIKEFGNTFEYKKRSSTADFYFYKNKLLYMMANFIYNYMPCFLLDANAVLHGRIPKMLDVYHKFKTSLDVLETFMNQEWLFHTKEAKGLYDSLDPSDKINFNFDTSDINWRNYFLNSCYGVQKFMLKDQSMINPPIPKHLLSKPGFFHLENITHKTD